MLIRSYADTSIGPCHRLRGIIWLDSPDEEMAHPMVMSADKISTMMLARPVFPDDPAYYQHTCSRWVRLTYPRCANVLKSRRSPL